MKEVVQCPNCGEKKIVKSSLTLLIIFGLLTFGIFCFIYILYMTHKCKCPKCGCIMKEVVIVNKGEYDGKHKNR